MNGGFIPGKFPSRRQKEKREWAAEARFREMEEPSVKHSPPSWWDNPESLPKRPPQKVGK